MTTNCIKFTSDDIETAKGIGSISTLTFDLDITVEPVASSNPMAPTHRVLGRSPRGKLVECGGIWKKQNKDTGSDYFTLTVRDHAFNANLGKAASQDDMSLQATSQTASAVWLLSCLVWVQTKRRSRNGISSDDAGINSSGSWTFLVKAFCALIELARHKVLTLSHAAGFASQFLGPSPPREAFGRGLANPT